MALAGCGGKAEVEVAAPPAVETIAAAPDVAAAPDIGAEVAADVAADAVAAEVEETTVAVAPPEPGVVSPKGVDAKRPRVSPDGASVLYESGADGKRDIFVVGADGVAKPIAADAADDKDAGWTADGKRVVFSSNRGGKYDLYEVPVDGSAAPRALGLAAAGDVSEPSVSPLRYSFYAVFPSSCSSDGAGADEVDNYEKAVFTRTDKDGKKEVWFASLNGVHTGRLSPAGTSCWAPRYSGDGLSMTMTCADKSGEKLVVHDTKAESDASLAAALELLAKKAGDNEVPGCSDPEDVKQWASDACLKKLPRRYAVNKPAPVAGEGVLASGYSTNQINVVGVGPEGAAVRERTKNSKWELLKSERTGTPLGQFDWSPDGATIVAEEKLADGTTQLVRVPTSYYLQDVKDLNDYPELWAPASKHMADNRFVVRGGTEKEFHKAYDKIMYARRGGFVTADAMLQAVRDEMASLIKKAEEGAAEELLALSEGLMRDYAAREPTPVNTFFAKHFAMAFVVLKAASLLPKEAEFDGNFGEEEGEEKTAKASFIDQIKAKLPEAIKELPPKIDVKGYLDKALAHEGFDDIDVPGLKDPYKVDFSQMKPRGHYAESALAGYFVAFKWLAMVPLSLDANAVELIETMEKSKLMAHWTKVDALVGAFMGKPVNVTVSHVLALRAKDPGIVKPFDAVKAVPALKAMLGDLGIRGLSKALADDAGEEAPDEPATLMLFPLRLGMDVPAFTGLTHPAVENRGLPSAVDWLAVLGAPAAVRIAKEQEKGNDYQAKYDEQLAKLQGKAPGKDDALWGTDLYHAWLALLNTMATPLKTPDEARLLFANNDAWADRLVSGALGGYAQLKHDAVLYAFQDFSAQCDGGYTVQVFVEQPILPEPRGFVEPNPAFFRATAALAKKAYAAFSPDGAEPTVETEMAETDEDGNPIILNARVIAERLAAIAEREVKSKPLSKEDYDYLRTIGGRLEQVFSSAQAGTGQGAGEGRLERGIALVADIHTNVSTQNARFVGIGTVDRIYVAVPDTVGARMTEGGVFGFYEFQGPINDRLTDEQWWTKLQSDDAPPRPSWVQSFFEAKTK